MVPQWEGGRDPPTPAQGILSTTGEEQGLFNYQTTHLGALL